MQLKSSKFPLKFPLKFILMHQIEIAPVPKSPRSPAQFHRPESRQLRGKQSMPAAMASDGYYDQESLLIEMNLADKKSNRIISEENNYNSYIQIYRRLGRG